ncbi:hypothetical protein X777_11913 [Ooceraea biroi]|uniref:Uncharacterized protein n=1 Tax=Ooceraea biroi TaxID=2015173 RepID=A0A026W0E7_OOCBI|nr:hypothetical protein X777_11913 [Ooceraea biroi]
MQSVPEGFISAAFAVNSLRNVPQTVYETCQAELGGDSRMRRISDANDNLGIPDDSFRCDPRQNSWRLHVEVARQESGKSGLTGNRAEYARFRARARGTSLIAPLSHEDRVIGAVGGSRAVVSLAAEFFLAIQDLRGTGATGLTRPATTDF